MVCSSPHYNVICHIYSVLLAQDKLWWLITHLKHTVIISSVTATYFCAQTYLEMGKHSLILSSAVLHRRQTAHPARTAYWLGVEQRRHWMFGAKQGVSAPTSSSRDGVKAASTVWRAMQLPRGTYHTVSHAALQAALPKVGFSCWNTGVSCCLRHLGASRRFSLDPQPPWSSPGRLGVHRAIILEWWMAYLCGKHVTLNSSAGFSLILMWENVY